MSKYVSSIPTVLSFDHERMLNFVKYFFCIFSSDHIIFILHSIKVVCHIYWFACGTILTSQRQVPQSHFENVQNWRHHTLWFQTILWRYNNLKSVVLAYEHIDQWNRTEWPEKFLTRKPRILNGENMISSINDVWKTEYSHAEEWS